MKRPLFGALWLLLAACGSSEPAHFSGTFTEADLNTVTIAPEQGAAVTFSTDEAELIGFDELLPGSPVKVTYTGAILKSEATPALRVEVDPTYARLLGRWIETGNGADEFGMGFELAASEGPRSPNAHSIGMHTLIFRQWRLTPEGLLWLSGHSLGNGNTVSFAEEWEIELLEADRLVISQPDLRLHLRRETQSDIDLRLAREAAAAEQHQPKSLKKKN